MDIRRWSTRRRDSESPLQWLQPRSPWHLACIHQLQTWASRVSDCRWCRDWRQLRYSRSHSRVRMGAIAHCGIRRRSSKYRASIPSLEADANYISTEKGSLVWGIRRSDERFYPQYPAAGAITLQCSHLGIRCWSTTRHSGSCEHFRDIICKQTQLYHKCKQRYE